VSCRFEEIRKSGVGVDHHHPSSSSSSSTATSAFHFHFLSPHSVQFQSSAINVPFHSVSPIITLDCCVISDDELYRERPFSETHHRDEHRLMSVADDARRALPDHADRSREEKPKRGFGIRSVPIKTASVGGAVPSSLR